MEEQTIEPESEKAAMREQIKLAMLAYRGKITCLAPENPDIPQEVRDSSRSLPYVGCHPLWEEGHSVNIRNMV